MNFRVVDMLSPVLLATGIVLGQAGQLDGSASVVLRPVMIAGLLGGVLYLLAAAMARTRSAAVIGSTAAVALLGGLALVVIVVGIAAVAVIVLYWGYIRGHPPLQARSFAVMTRRLVAIFALVGLIGFIASQPVLYVPGPPSARAGALSGAPPIALILLDGYPRQDMLNRYFGTDNQSFLDALTERGFDVYPDATTNHHFTALSLATMFNAAPASELAVEETTRPGQFRALYRLFNEGSVWDELRDAGYTIATIPPTPDGVRLMTADVYQDEDNMSGFEVHLVENTGLGALLDMAGVDLVNDQHRARLNAGFEVLPELTDSRTFLLAHFFLPHRPLVFQADGSPRAVGACQEECTDAEFYPDFAEQLSHTNDQVIEAVDRLPSNAVVVIFSDHGSRETADPEEWLRSLLVARTPDHPRLFGDRPQPLSWLPRLLNAYTGTHLPETHGGHWRSHHLPMDMEAIDP